MIMIIIVRDVRGTHHSVTFQNSSLDNKKTDWCKFVTVVNVLFSICSITERCQSNGNVVGPSITQLYLSIRWYALDY